MSTSLTIQKRTNVMLLLGYKIINKSIRPCSSCNQYITTNTFSRQDLVSNFVMTGSIHRQSTPLANFILSDIWGTQLDADNSSLYADIFCVHMPSTGSPVHTTKEQIEHVTMNSSHQTGIFSPGGHVTVKTFGSFRLAHPLPKGYSQIIRIR